MYAISRRTSFSVASLGLRSRGASSPVDPSKVSACLSLHEFDCLIPFSCLISDFDSFGPQSKMPSILGLSLLPFGRPAPGLNPPLMLSPELRTGPYQFPCLT